MFRLLGEVVESSFMLGSRGIHQVAGVQSGNAGHQFTCINIFNLSRFMLLNVAVILRSHVVILRSLLLFEDLSCYLKIS